jgi:hypothetical protein
MLSFSLFMASVPQALDVLKDEVSDRFPGQTPQMIKVMHTTVLDRVRFHPH